MTCAAPNSTGRLGCVRTPLHPDGHLWVCADTSPDELEDNR